MLEAPREAIHNQAFNVGSSQENYQIRDVADMVQEVVPGCTVKYLEGGGPDPRCYRVNCDKLTAHIPGFKTEWTVRRGVEELYESFVRNGLTARDVRAATCGSSASRRCCATAGSTARCGWQAAAVAV